ncbi:TPA: efflux RND transporter periplasmic adaptor subunit [Legionella pneumophila]|nr:efflux RND transporter periplasmic adaptor subunit [Legionella pneumophila]HAU2406559.1 efflux RND transporter periplasmic adaptor subunit [Legionella pneumophila]
MNKKLLAIIVIAIILGVFLGRCTMEFTSKKVASSKEDKKPLYWIDAMEPTIHYSGPGKSRMGMELTPVYADENQDESAVKISPTVINNMGVRIAPVKKTVLARQIDTVGYVEPNENQIGHIHTYADGWVKNLVVKTVGETVKKGQLLLEYYSPALVTAQEEYLIALEGKNPTLIKASYKKLQALHISEQQIEQIKSSRKSNHLVAIYAPQDGIVAQLNIREGMRVTPDIEMMSLVDLSTVWMIAQIFEEQANWVHVGDIAEARISAFPQKLWKGSVEYIYPQLEPMTRTIKVRFRFDNPDNQLKPNMYVSISILAKPKENTLTVPLEAVIRSSQGDRVIVALNKGRFEVRPVTIGMESGGQVEILSGLKLGEHVVISGQFLIDSEANLKAGLGRMQTSTQNANAEQESSYENTQSFEAKGIIKAVNLSQNTVTIQHEPIPDLNWPMMTMSFHVASDINLKQFKEGENISFTLQKRNNEQVIVTSIRTLNKQGESHGNKKH